MVKYLTTHSWTNIGLEVRILRFTHSDTHQKVNLYAEKDGKTILIECKGDSRRRRNAIQDLYIVFGQAFYLLGSTEEVGIAIPHYWHKNLIEKNIFSKILRQPIKVFLVSEDKVQEY